MDTLRGKTAVVTGGRGGLGRGIVDLLVAAGGRVVVSHGDTAIRLTTDPGAGAVSWRVTLDGPTALTSAGRVNPLA
jgi:NAD(P)-dependent dehydrogenase (short-subunit alcohol dehydrogenase family)